MASDPNALEQRTHKNGGSSYFFLLLETQKAGTAIVGNPIPISQPVADMFVNHSSPTIEEHPPESASLQKTPEIKSLGNEQAVREFVRTLLTTPDPAERKNAPHTSKGIPSESKASEKKNTDGSSPSVSDRLKSFLPFSPSQHRKPTTEVAKANEKDATPGSVCAEDSEDDDDDINDSDEELAEGEETLPGPKLDSCAGNRSAEIPGEGPDDQEENCDDEDPVEEEEKDSPRSNRKDCFKRFRYDGFGFQDRGNGWGRYGRSKRHSPGSRKRR